MPNRPIRRGATTVEFAFALPVLFIFIFGSAELTRVAMLRHTANHAAYIATRAAIVPGANADDVVIKAEQHLEKIGITGGEVTVSPPVITEATQLVSVTVRFPISGNALAVPEFASGEIVGQSMMVTERPKAVMSLNLPAPTPSTPSTAVLSSPFDIAPISLDFDWPTIPTSAPPPPPVL